MKKFYIAKSRRLRSTPFTSRIENHGVTAYTTYNHMLLPASFGNLEKEYFHLKIQMRFHLGYVEYTTHNLIY